VSTKKYKVLVCTINWTLNKKEELIMGAGIAKDFKMFFHDLPKLWGGEVKKHKEPKLLINEIDNFLIVGLPTKINWKNNSLLPLIEQSVIDLSHSVVGKYNVLMTRPGCGMGGL